MLNRFISNRVLHMILLFAMLGGALALSFSHARWREQIRNFTFDNYNIMKPRVASDSVVIINIDEASLKKYGQMPWPRDVMAQLVATLKDMGASVIAFDIVFPEPDRMAPENDEIFGNAITQAGNVIVGFSFTNEPTDSVPVTKGIFRGKGIEHFIPRLVGATVNQKSISKNAAGSGSFFVSTDTDGIIRRVPMLVGYQLPGTKITSVYPSLSLETVRVLSGERGGRVLLDNPEYAKLDPHRFGVSGIRIGDGVNITPSPILKKTIPTNAHGEFLVYFAKSNSAWYIPAWQVLDKSLPPKKIKGKIVLIGTSAVGLKDIRSTPLDTFIPGVEVHLNILDQILQGKFLQRSIEAEGLEAVAILCAGLFIILFSPFVGALAQMFVVVLVLMAGILGGWNAFIRYGLLIDVTYPGFAVLAMFMLSVLLTYLRSERERRQVRQAFGLYISPDFMKELTRDPDKLKLGGETRELSVMFTDIRNFTTICEGLAPQQIIQLMNDFLTPMSDLVMQNRGTIDKYIGDAMMAFWNAPLDDAAHARHACVTALGMQLALEPVNDKIKARGGKTLLKVGIGINTGPCAVGNMGSKQRFAYSSLGDAVNLAARFEGQTKEYGVPVIIGESTRMQAPEMAALDIDMIRVKGKTQAVRIFALLGDEKLAALPNFKKLSETHDAMMRAYRTRNFSEASKIAESCENSQSFNLEMLYGMYQARLQALITTPPASDWDGVYEAKTK